MEDYPSGSFVAAALIAAYFSFALGGNWVFGLVALVMLYYAVRNLGRQAPP